MGSLEAKIRAEASTKAILEIASMLVDTPTTSAEVDNFIGSFLAEIAIKYDLHNEIQGFLIDNIVKNLPHTK